jgi:hypothetical protein
MSIISNVRIYNCDGVTTETLPADAARWRVYQSGGEWSFVAPPPLNWELTVPRYKFTRDLRPSPNQRHRLETPFATIWESDIWQFAERNYAANEQITTGAWPHESMRPAGSAGEAYAAERVLSFFVGAMKSPTAPWHQGRIRLDTGLSGTLPKLQAMTSRPAA